jgi:hypothetical protein
LSKLTTCSASREGQKPMCVQCAQCCALSRSCVYSLYVYFAGCGWITQLAQ